MQSRSMSAVEACVNVLAGWLSAFAMQLVLFPAVGLQITLAQHLTVSGAFTALSLARSYILRRMFVSMERDTSLVSPHADHAQRELR